MTASIPTAAGPVGVADLGRVSMHEHVLIVDPLLLDYPDVAWNGDKVARIDRAVDELDRLKGLGIDTIVDLTVPGLGRSIVDVEAIAARTELQILVATGFYTFADLPAGLRTRAWRRSPGGAIEDVLVEMFVREIEVGIAGTAVKAAILKCCTDKPGMTAGVERVIRATAWAHRATGVPISTHTDAASRSGRDQQRVFEEEGVDLTRVIIGHCGDTLDLDYLRELMDRGSSIGSDRFGFYVPGSPTLTERVEVIAQLVAEGYADRIVLGHDAHCYADWNHEDDPHRGLDKWHYRHLPTEVLPQLREAGVSEEDLEQMQVANPARLLRRRAPY